VQPGLALRRRIVVDVFLAALLLAAFIVVLRIALLAAEFNTTVAAESFAAFRAARDYGLEYRTLKAIARNALLYAFLDAGQKRAELERFDRASADFDRASADFERSATSRQTPLQNVVTLLKAAVTPPP